MNEDKFMEVLRQRRSEAIGKLIRQCAPKWVQNMLLSITRDNDDDRLRQEFAEAVWITDQLGYKIHFKIISDTQEMIYLYRDKLRLGAVEVDYSDFI